MVVMRAHIPLLAAAVVALVLSPSVSAKPAPLVEPAPGEGANVPGMVYGAVINTACDGEFPFGRSSKGLTLACVTVGKDDDGNTLRSWVRSVPLAGVRQPMGLCENEYGMAALSPQSEAMLCMPQARQGPPMWAVDPDL